MRPPHLPTLIIKNISRLKETVSVDDEGDITQGFLDSKLAQYNIQFIFKPIYDTHVENKRVAILKTAFVILAYTFNSDWINVDKDRYINKKEILATLVEKSGITLDECAIEDILLNKDLVLREAINTYIGWQKDSDFTHLFTLLEHISTCNKMATSNDANLSDKMLVDRTRYLNDIDETEKKKQALIAKLESKYMILDEVALKEGRKQITKDIDISVYENRLKIRLGLSE